MNNTSSNDEEGDDAEKMRLAFESFMLTGKKPKAEEKNDDETASMATSQSATSKSKKKKKKKKSLGGTPPPKPSMPPKAKATGLSPPPQYAKQSAMAKSDKKRYFQLLRSFNDKVQHTWLDIDNQMLDVLQNVVSIRGRLPLEWKLLQSSRKSNGGPEEDSGDEWKYHGFQGKPKEVSYAMHLHTEDIQLALSNDLVQHEKMLAGLRSLISDLAECHEALGRVVDTLWQFHLECADVQEGREGGPSKEEEEMEHIVQSVTDAYQMLSMELYRKQGMVPMVTESTEDEILGIEGEKSNADEGQQKGGSLQTARACCRSWKRGSEQSCVNEDLLSRLLKPGETSQAKVER